MYILISPLPHQIPILEQLEKDREKGKTLVVIPSGAGKTHIAAFDSLSSNAKSILYIAHKIEILKQAAKVFKKIHNITDDDIGFLDKDNKDMNKRILFATNNSLAKSKNLDVLSKSFDYIVIDEYHHVAAATYQMILNSINSNIFMLGLTATAFRGDKQDIMTYVNGNISTKMDLKEGVAKNILVPYHYKVMRDNIVYPISLGKYEYNVKDLDKKLLIDKRDNQIINEYLDNIGKTHSTIAFCTSIKHCERIVRKFNKKGVSARMITYKSSKEERDMNYIDFAENLYDVLVVKDVYNEGIDFPNVEGVLFLRPTESRVIFLQQLGRGLRRKDGKTHVTVLDFVQNIESASELLEELKKQGAVEEQIDEDTTERSSKPVYNHPVSTYYFEQEVIEDIFEYRKPVKEQLIYDYLRIVKLVGRSIRVIEYDRHPDAKFHTHQFIYAFKSLDNFYRIVNQYQFTRTTKESLINNYNEIIKKIGHPVHINEYQKHPDAMYNSSDFIFWFKSIDNFYKLNGNPELCKYKYKDITLDVVKQMHIDLSNKLQKKLISQIEFQNEYGAGSIKRFIKSLGGFRVMRKILFPDLYIRQCEFCGMQYDFITAAGFRSKYCSKICLNNAKKMKYKSNPQDAILRSRQWYKENRSRIIENRKIHGDEIRRIAREKYSNMTPEEKFEYNHKKREQAIKRRLRNKRI